MASPRGARAGGGFCDAPIFGDTRINPFSRTALPLRLCERIRHFADFRMAREATVATERQAGMTFPALALVFIAAFTHATWNYAAKRSGGGLPFVWLTGLLSLTLYIPVVVSYSMWRGVSLPDGTLLVVLGSGLIKTAYSLLLQRGYRHGDFSLVYPLARGTGPLLSTIAAIAIFGERPSALALAGGAAIVASVFYLTGGTSALHKQQAHLRQGLLYGVVCGCGIAGYTVWDQRAVSQLHIAPPLYDFGTQLVMCTILAPFGWARRREVAEAWRKHRGKALIVAFLAPRRLYFDSDGDDVHARDLHRTGARSQHFDRCIFWGASVERSGCAAPTSGRRPHGGGNHRARLGLSAGDDALTTRL